MASANLFNLILPKHFQERFMYTDLMARRTKRQESRIYWRGKGLGGSTAVNAQIAIRGLLHAFDRWAAMGCTGWREKTFYRFSKNSKTIRSSPTITGRVARSLSIAHRSKNGAT
jgi:choline dehydrogenase-like flavoprotein